ncbi:hypothetical protein [Dryocola sp. BD626]|uniref:hypothetical protein n=1 Tax=Dryocola sp. BD626 TaxID=3133273 RepID=UPI003F4FBBD2
MSNKQKITVKIDWLDNCPKCGHGEAAVTTQGYGSGTLWSGDQVMCMKCGHCGEIDADGENAWVEWNELEDTNEQ